MSLSLIGGGGGGMSVLWQSDANQRESSNESQSVK